LFVLEDRKPKDFLTKVSRFVVSSDGKKALVRIQGKWNLVDTKPEKVSPEALNIKLEVRLDRSAEWKQMFEGASPTSGTGPISPMSWTR
jgi:tricorn protease